MDTAQAKEIGTGEAEDLFSGMLQGFRFRVCEDAETVARALEVRRKVYVEGSGYDIPVPDQYDTWSWLLIAEDMRTGEAVGTMRLTPRAEGPLEAEEYFRLPRELRTAKTVEINRFAILPAYRKGKTFLPIVSIGLFKLAKQVVQREGMRHVVLCSKAERIWTYRWLGFDQTGLTVRYEKLNNAEHELLSIDLTTVDQRWADNPLAPFLLEREHAEIELPMPMPAVGLVDPALTEGLRLKKSA
jgi:hypothetical protein